MTSLYVIAYVTSNDVIVGGGTSDDIITGNVLIFDVVATSLLWSCTDIIYVSQEWRPLVLLVFV